MDSIKQHDKYVDKLMLKINNDLNVFEQNMYNNANSIASIQDIQRKSDMILLVAWDKVIIEWVKLHIISDNGWKLFRSYIKVVDIDKAIYMLTIRDLELLLKGENFLTVLCSSLLRTRGVLMIDNLSCLWDIDQQYILLNMITVFLM